MIGFEDQLRCCALARQALHGDAPKTTTLAPCERSSWESLRGMAKEKAEEQLVKELAEKDSGFRKAPKCHSSGFQSISIHCNSTRLKSFIDM